MILILGNFSGVLFVCMMMPNLFALWKSGKNLMMLSYPCWCLACDQDVI